MVYHETGHASPWNPDQRLGRGRFTSGLFARDLGDGRARWFVPFDAEKVKTQYLPKAKEIQAGGKKYAVDS